MNQTLYGEFLTAVLLSEMQHNMDYVAFGGNAGRRGFTPLEPEKITNKIGANYRRNEPTPKALQRLLPFFLKAHRKRGKQYGRI